MSTFDVAGEYDVNHLDVSYANIGSITLTCDGDTAVDEFKKDPFRRIDRATFDAAVAAWPHP